MSVSTTDINDRATDVSANDAAEQAIGRLIEKARRGALQQKAERIAKDSAPVGKGEKVRYRYD